MAVNMFRAVFLCVIIAVAQSQLTCIKMSASQMGGGLCDGMMASWSACAASGTTTQPVYAWAGLDAVACGTQQGTMCAIGGGTAHKPFCASGVTSGFCQMIHARLLSKTPTCSTDADCANTLAPDRTVGCCADYKTVLGQMCTGIVDLDAAVNMLKGANACADINCFKVASAHSVRASSLAALAPLLLAFAFFKF